MLGPLPIPRGMLAPTGEKGTVHYGAVFAVRDGRIATQHVYDPARLRPSTSTTQHVYLDRAAVLGATRATELVTA